MRKNLIKQLKQITDTKPERRVKKMELWKQFADYRLEFCDALQREGIAGSQYSSKVAEWDAKFAPLFGKKWFQIETSN